MLYGIAYGLIVVVSLIFLCIDLAITKIDAKASEQRKDRVDSVMRSIFEITVSLPIVVALWATRQHLENLSLLSEKQVAVLIFEVLWLMLLRKILVIMLPSILVYAFWQAPSLAQRYERFIFRNGNGIPLITGSGIALMYVLLMLPNLVTTMFQGLALSRLNVLTNKFGQLGLALVTKPAVTLVWYILFLTFWYCLIRLTVTIFQKVRNTNADGSIKKPDAWCEKINLGLLLAIAIALIPIRKLYDWIFVMSNYRMEDFMFSVAVLVLTAVYVAIKLLRKR